MFPGRFEISPFGRDDSGDGYLGLRPGGVVGRQNRPRIVKAIVAAGRWREEGFASAAFPRGELQVSSRIGKKIKLF